MNVYEGYSAFSRKTTSFSRSQTGYIKYPQRCLNESAVFHERNDSSPDSFQGDEVNANDTMTPELPGKSYQSPKISNTKYKKPDGLKFLNTMKKIFTHGEYTNLEDNNQIPISWSSVYKKIFNRRYDEKLNMDEIELRFRSIFDTLNKENSSISGKKEDSTSNVRHSLIIKILRNLNNYEEDHKNDNKIAGDIYFSNANANASANANYIPKTNQTVGLINLKHATSIRKLSATDVRNLIRPLYSNLTIKKLQCGGEQRRGSVKPMLRSPTIKNPLRRFTTQNIVYESNHEILSRVTSGTTHNTTNKDKPAQSLEGQLAGNEYRTTRLFKVSNNPNKNYSLLDYIIGTAEKLNSNRDKLLSQDQRRLLSDHCFLKTISGKTSPLIEDVENIKHQITTYEKELCSMKNMFKNPSVRGLDQFFCFDDLRNEIQFTITNMKRISQDKIERKRVIIDKIIALLTSRGKQ